MNRIVFRKRWPLGFKLIIGLSIEYYCLMKVFSPQNWIYFNWSDRFHLPPYLDRLKLLNMHSLAMRRTVAGVSFIHQTLAGNINSPFILSRLKLNVNHHSLRNVGFFFLPTCRTDYSKYEPISRMIRDVNSFAGFDVSMSKHALKNMLYSSLSSHES